MIYKVTAIIAILVASLSTEVSGHGVMTQPKPEWTAAAINKGSKNGPSDTGNWDGTEDLAKLAKNKCGHTKEDSAPQPIPSKMIYGASARHVGPCALYINGQQTAYKESCIDANYELPIDASKCGSSCKLQFVWVATHQGAKNSEIYAYCANLGGGNKTGGKDGKDGGGNSTDAPVTKPDQPKPTSTDAPVTKPDQPKPKTDQPKPVDNGETRTPDMTGKPGKNGEVTNAPNTDMPAASGKPKMKTNCKRRLRTD